MNDMTPATGLVNLHNIIGHLKPRTLAALIADMEDARKSHRDMVTVRDAALIELQRRGGSAKRDIHPMGCIPRKV